MASTTEIAGIALWDLVLRLFYHLVPRPKHKVLGIIYGKFTNPEPCNWMVRSASCHAPIIAHCASIDSRISSFAIRPRFFNSFARSHYVLRDKWQRSFNDQITNSWRDCVDRLSLWNAKKLCKEREKKKRRKIELIMSFVLSKRNFLTSWKCRKLLNYC